MARFEVFESLVLSPHESNETILDVERIESVCNSDDDFGLQGDGRGVVVTMQSGKAHRLAASEFARLVDFTVGSHLLSLAHDRTSAGQSSEAT